MIGVFVNGEHQELCVRQERLELAHALDAVEPGQVDVHQDDFGLCRRQRRQRALGAAVFAHAAKALGAANPVGQNLSGLGIVLDD